MLNISLNSHNSTSFGKFFKTTVSFYCFHVSKGRMISKVQSNFLFISQVVFLYLKQQNIRNKLKKNKPSLALKILITRQHPSVAQMKYIRTFWRFQRILIAGEISGLLRCGTSVKIDYASHSTPIGTSFTSKWRNG